MRSYSTTERKSSPWVLDTKSENEQVVLGTYFATAISAIAAGQREKLKSKKIPNRVLYYDDKAFNPSLHFAPTEVAIEAFVKERDKYWSGKGMTLSKQPRDCQVNPTSYGDSGPKNPEQFPHIYESSIRTFGRNREIRPFSRISKNLDKPNIPALQEALVKRIPTVNPMSYHMPDLWKSASSSSLHESSVFKSKTKRLDYEDPLPLEDTKFRRSLEQDRGRNLGRSLSPLEDMNKRKGNYIPPDGLHLGERGMQNIDDDYVVSSSHFGGGMSHVLNIVDPNIRNASKELRSRHEASLLSLCNTESCGNRFYSDSSSPTSRSRAQSPGRPVSPTPDIIAHSRQKGFAFGGAEMSHKNVNDDSFKVFIREQSDNGGYTIRSVTLKDYLSREDSFHKEIEAQIHQHAISLSHNSSSIQKDPRHGSSHPVSQPLSFAATDSYASASSRAQTSHQMSHSKESIDNVLGGHHSKSQHFRHVNSAPVKLGITNSRRVGGGSPLPVKKPYDVSNIRIGSIVMDDSLFGDDDDSIGDPQHGPDDDVGDKKPPVKSYNKVIIARWTPPMCYSKKKAQDHFLFQRSHVSSTPQLDELSPSGSAPASYFASKPRLKNPGKTFEQADYHLASQGHHKNRPKTTSAV